MIYLVLPLVGYQDAPALSFGTIRNYPNPDLELIPLHPARFAVSTGANGNSGFFARTATTRLTPDLFKKGCHLSLTLK